MTFTRSIFWDARLWESMSLSFKSVGCRMHTFSSSMWSCVSKCPMHGRWQMQKTISTQVPIRDGDGCKKISYLLMQRYEAHNFGSRRWNG
jgi:hypothetical protein